MAPKEGSSTSGSGAAAFRIRWGRSSSSTSTLTPSLLTDQRNEAHFAEVRLLKASVFPLGHSDEFLHPAGDADRHDEPSTESKLRHKRRRNVTSAGCREN